MFSLWCVKAALVLYMWLEINLHVVSIIQMLEAWKVPVSAHVCIFVMYNIKWPLRKLIGGSKMTHFLVEHTNQQFYSVWKSWIMSDFIFSDMHSILTGLGGNQKDEKDVGDRTPHHSGVKLYCKVNKSLN